MEDSGGRKEVEVRAGILILGTGTSELLVNLYGF